ncbi:hypothetical protein [Paraflavitalea pollutisoli]|uniref:hypothetical protein n=1 Tax=Paraflavitalea pollutisoli TaxID=3034143 RepID=UPI0023ED8B77|nr:hypothetical protein [Paraflavitalea sp. H1-2-19X]
MKHYNKLSDAVNELRNEGYAEELPDESFCLYCNNLELRINPDLHVDQRVHVGPADQPEAGEVVYAISTPNGVKVIEVEEEGKPQGPQAA